MKIITCLMLILLFISCVGGPSLYKQHNEMVKQHREQREKTPKKVVLENESSLKIDDVVFEEGDLMRIIDNDNQIIVRFDRVDNKSLSQVKGVKVYDEDNNHIYTLIPSVSGQELKVNIKEIASDLRGTISMSTSVNGFSIEVNTDVDFFEKPYTIEYEIIHGTDGISQTTIVSYDSRALMYRRVTASMNGVEQTGFMVDKSFLEVNKIDMGVLALSIKLIDEINEAFSSNNTGSNNRGTSFNTNGTPDYNNNPMDNF